MPRSDVIGPCVRVQEAHMVTVFHFYFIFTYNVIFVHFQSFYFMSAHFCWAKIFRTAPHCLSKKRHKPLCLFLLLLFCSCCHGVCWWNRERESKNKTSKDICMMLQSPLLRSVCSWKWIKRVSRWRCTRPKFTPLGARLCSFYDVNLRHWLLIAFHVCFLRLFYSYEFKPY